RLPLRARRPHIALCGDGGAPATSVGKSSASAQSTKRPAVRESRDHVEGPARASRHPGGTSMNAETVRDTQKASTNPDAPRTRLIAGVTVADNPLITAVIEYAQRLSEPYLFNHAMRSWLFAEAIGRIKRIDYDHEVVA